MGITVKIAGVDRTEYVDARSLSIIDELTSRVNSASFVFICNDIALAPTDGESILIEEGSTKLFSGRILTKEEDFLNPNLLKYQVECIDNTRDLDKKLVIESYVNTLAGDIIKDIISKYTSGFTTTNVANGPTITRISFDYIQVSETITKIAETCGYEWYVDYDKDIHFFLKTAYPASFQLDDDQAHYRDLIINTDISQLRNRVYVKSSKYETLDFTELFIGDGETLTWTCKYQANALPAPSLKLNGVSKTVGWDGVDNPDDYHFMLNASTKVLSLGTKSNYTWDILTALYINKSKNITDQDTFPQGVFFKTDGSKMYVIGTENDKIYQYSLSTPWDVSTATYDNKFYDISGQNTMPQDIFFKPDGTKMYMVGNIGHIIYQYSLSTPWDIETANYDDKSCDVTEQETSPQGVFFKSDGSKMYVAGIFNGAIYQYSLSTSWDVSTASYDSKFCSVISQDPSPTGVFFKSDGSKMYVVGFNNNRVYQYSLSSAWDISTATYNNKYCSVMSEDSEGLTFKSDGTKMYVVGLNKIVYQYSFSIPADGDEIVITYGADEPIIIRWDDQDSIDAVKAIEGGDGIHEYCIVDNNIDTKEWAIDRAKADLLQNANPVIQGTFVTNQSDIRSGQIITLNSTKRNINQNFLVQKVELVRVDVHFVGYPEIPYKPAATATIGYKLATDAEVSYKPVAGEYIYYIYQVTIATKLKGLEDLLLQLLYQSSESLKRDTEAPDVPAGLALSTGMGSITQASLAWLKAEWNANTEDDFSHYELKYKKTAYSDFGLVTTTNTSFIWTGLEQNIEYEVYIRAVDIYGNRSSWSSQETQTTATDSDTPAQVTGAVATAILAGIKIIWTGATEGNIAGYIVERQESDDGTTWTGEWTERVRIDAYMWLDLLLTYTKYYRYRIKAFTQTGTEGSTSTPTADSIKPNKAGTNDIVAYSITADLIAANSIYTNALQAGVIIADKIAADAIETDKIKAGAVTAGKINVDTLEAISANMGTLTAGIIDGGLFKVGTAGNIYFKSSTVYMFDFANGLGVGYRGIALKYSASRFFDINWKSGAGVAIRAILAAGNQIGIGQAGTGGAITSAYGGHETGLQFYPNGDDKLVTIYGTGTLQLPALTSAPAAHVGDLACNSASDWFVGYISDWEHFQTTDGW